MKILIVEDNETNAKVIERFVAKLGFESAIVSTGEDAIEQVKANRHDLVFMDCEMPVMDGYETSRKIRELEKAARERVPILKRIPIVALTAHSHPKDKTRCEQAVMDDYLCKPVSLADIKNAIEKWTHA